MSKKRKPRLCLHAATGRARVWIDGKYLYLGPYNSQESLDEYDDLIAEWLHNNGDTRRYSLTVDELALMYLEHADQYYRKNGKPTGEAKNIRYAFRFIIDQFGSKRARAFGPLSLKAVRQSMIEAGMCRTSINRHVARIKSTFKWSAENELLPITAYQALATVAGLKRNRSDAKESDPVTAVAIDHVHAIEPFVTRPVWGLIQFQLFTGARPGEACRVRGRNINMGGAVWEYVPDSHKTEHRNKQRIIFIGPRGKDLVRDFLKTDLNAYLFSPRDGRRNYEQSNYKRSAKKRSGKHQPRDCYAAESLGGAIRNACIRADVPHWHANQLRHLTWRTGIANQFPLAAIE